MIWMQVLNKTNFKAKKECKVYDAVFHSKTIAKCLSDLRFKDLIISTAIEGIEKQFKIKLGKYKILKLKAKGVIPSTVIRVKKETKNDAKTEAKTETSIEYIGKILESQKNTKTEESNKVPEYSIIHQGVISDYTDFTNSREKAGTRPNVLLIKVKLPKVESISQIELDTFEKFLELQVPGMYEVVIPLPFSVVHDKGTAKFDKSTKELAVSLPVVKPAVSKPEKVLIEEVEEEDPQNASGDLESCIQEEEKTTVISDQQLDTPESSSISNNYQDKLNQTKVPIFHMRQDMSTLSFMIPLQIKQDNSEIHFTEHSV